MVWRSVSDTQWHENKKFEVKRFLKLIVSWQRKPRNQRRRCSGTGQLDRRHWNVKNIAEHTSRIELGVLLALQVRDPHVMRNESEKGLLVVGVDHGYLWSRSAENAGDVGEAEDDDCDPFDGVRTGSPVLCGPNSGNGWIFSNVLQSKGNSERNISVLSQESMAGGYKRQLVKIGREAALVSHVRMAILLTMADGPYEVIQQQTSKGQPLGNGLAEGGV